MKRLIFISMLVYFIFAGCQSQSRNRNHILTNNTMAAIQITSPAFKNDGPIPPKYTCSGEDINPPITIKGVPVNAKSLVLILDDPDTPFGTFTHWIMWNIPPQTTVIPENDFPKDAIQGKNSAGKNNYFGPCPPSGTHHYHFKIFALDTVLDLPENTKVKQLEKAMKPHIIARGELIGLFHK